MKYRLTSNVTRQTGHGNNFQKRARSLDRQGAAAVETAILLPVFVFIFLAMIDIGQAIHLRHSLENAAHEAARMAAKDDFESAAEIRGTILDHLKKAYPKIETPVLEQALTTKFYYIDTQYGGNTIYTPEDLTEIPSGQSVHVEVAFHFELVRWVPGFDVWNSAFFETVTVCRRE